MTEIQGMAGNFYSVNNRSGDLESAIPAYNRFGVQSVLRLHAAYRWEQFVFSAGAAGGYDFKPAVTAEGCDKKRYYLTPQTGLHWRF